MSYVGQPRRGGIGSYADTKTACVFRCLPIRFYKHRNTLRVGIGVRQLLASGCGTSGLSGYDRHALGEAKILVIGFTYESFGFYQRRFSTTNVASL